MKKYRITFEELNEVYIEAKDKNEAIDMFHNAIYDTTEHLATNMINIEVSK
jgi:hypothetical protein